MKNNLTTLPVADGIVILNSAADISPEFLEYCSAHSYEQISKTTHINQIDRRRTNLLYAQLSPTHYCFTPKRFSNDFKNDKKLTRAICKYKHKFPNTLCYFQNEWAPDEMLPSFARKIGIRFKLFPVFQRLKYQPSATNKNRGDVLAFGPKPVDLLSCVVTEHNFDIEYNKFVSVISLKDAPNFSTEYETLVKIYQDASLNEQQKKSKASQYLKTLSPISRNLVREVLFYSDDICLKSIIAHELKHVINEILLNSRRAKKECGKLNSEQMLRLFIHDEISASTQEILTIFGEIYQDRRLSDILEAIRLCPLHFQKFLLADEAGRAKMLHNPSPIVSEISKNWMKKKYGIYASQFEDLFEDLRSSYPAHLWSQQKDNDPSEYLLQKRLCYTFEIYDPDKGHVSYVNCHDAVDDEKLRIPRNVRREIKWTNEKFKYVKSQLSEYGITDALISQARAKSHSYQKTISSEEQKSAHTTLELILQKYTQSEQR